MPFTYIYQFNSHLGLLDFLSILGLEKYYPNKLSLQSVLEINKNSIFDDTAKSVKDIAWCFLRKLFKVNAESRSCMQLKTNDHEEEENDQSDCDNSSKDDEINPLDVIVALFLCADNFLQQEMALKMSMCQFSLPLLLPHGNNSQCTLMLWALRNIIKEWRPRDMTESRGFVESSIIEANMPILSFVKLKNCSLSKSQVLNHILSNDQHNNNIFIHRDMKGGSYERKISNGLVEICWYLPSGSKKRDIFPNPVAFANLRGDICESVAQFKFLFQMSTAMFVFLDKVEENDSKTLSSLEDVRSKLFLVINCKADGAGEDMTVKTMLEKLDLPKGSRKTKDPKINVAEFSHRLRKEIKKSLTDKTTTMKMENMLETAVDLCLYVDERKSDEQKKAAEDIVKGIGVHSIPDYKKHQLPLQGVNWKRLSQIEMEECRLTNTGDVGVEEYKSQLQAEKQQNSNDLGKQKQSKAMKSFIQLLSVRDKDKRDFFFKWLQLKLNAHLHYCVQPSPQQNKLKDNCSTMEKDLKPLLPESSLGIEHYMREMGLIYEVSLPSQETAEEISHLPGVTAEMLLDGYALELLDGDASNIPEKWVTDVLMELHKKVGGRSRLLVLTVLGVQSTGKSTLLNTMFGVQFPVSSGRCTRGAYMLFLRVGEDMQSDMNCDFIVLIDTEGLKSPQLVQLEDSYEHDNQLATFVIGLSDVTIINVAMENSTEMKDVLQIVTHAFLRMKEIGKRPVCHFVHQNVAAVSAHGRTMTERESLLDQLNEMTQLAAGMEKLPSIQAFTDVLDYDVDKNNWNIPGLWHGTPPMAPVNTGYSEAVADFKEQLLETMRRERSNEVAQIPEFLQWMRSLWKAVKCENFIFSFRNTLVANAYDSLCKEFSEWEWEFRKEIHSWQTAADLEILNAEASLCDLNKLSDSKKSEVSGKISDQETLMKNKLKDYYKRKDRHVNMIEKYRVDFLNSISSLAKEIQHSVNNKLDCALDLRATLEKTQEIQEENRTAIEEAVKKLLSDCRESTLSEEQLKDEFEKMWTEVTVNVSGLKEQNISESVLKQLKKKYANRNFNEELQKIGDLKAIGESPFKVKSKHLTGMERFKNLLPWEDAKRDLQIFADSVIASCTRDVIDIGKSNEDYNDSFTKDLLEKIDKYLEPQRKKCNHKFEIDLNLHVCGIASREFLHMHRKFLLARDPKVQLEKNKSQYLSDFLDLYQKRDHCQRKATDYVQSCIKPAVEDYIDRYLGRNILDEILKSPEYGSRPFFQFSILKELMQKEDFQSFLQYIRNYEIYVKDWILQHIVLKMLEDNTLCKLKNKNLPVVVDRILKAIDLASKGPDGVLLSDDQKSITTLISSIKKALTNDVSISAEDEKNTPLQSRCHPFINSLKTSINDLKEQLQSKSSNAEDIAEILYKLPNKPQNELFSRVFGCGKHCPFCEVPCEAVGREHKQHHAAVHRPQGLARCRYENNGKLVETLCTTNVHSQHQFKNIDTEWESCFYKDYTAFYPDWHIPPGPTIEASHYWKYVLVRYNEEFAREYEAKPADVPKAWRSITKEQALRSLNDAFNIR